MACWTSRTQTPERSLLLAKGAAQVPHGGGLKLEDDSPGHRRLARWIVAGAPREAADEREAPATGSRLIEIAKRKHPGAVTYLRAGVGFGGSCFPKDVKAIFEFAQAQGAAMPLLVMTLWSVNQ